MFRKMQIFIEIEKFNFHSFSGKFRTLWTLREVYLYQTFKNEFLFKFHIPKFTNGLWNLKTEILVFMKTLLSSLVLPELWSCGVVVITTAQLHLTKPEIRFCAGSNPAHGMSETCEGEDL